MSSRDQQPDPDDFFAETRMSFGEHIEDLRTHLWRAIKGFFVAVIFSFFSGKSVRTFIAKPVEDQLAEFYDRRVQKVEEDLQANNASLVEKNRLVPEQRLMPREDFERLAGRVAHVVTSGTRAWDMAVRLKSAGVETGRIEPVKSEAKPEVPKNEGPLELRRSTD